MIARVAMMTLVLATALLLGTVIVPAISTGIWRPDLVVLTVVAFGLTDGSDTGARYGFTAGLAVDLLSAGSQLVGTAALVLLLVGYVSGMARPYLSSTGIVGQVAMAAAASTLAILSYGLLSQFLEVASSTPLAALQSGLATGLYNAVLAPFVLIGVGTLSRRLPGAPSATA